MLTIPPVHYPEVSFHKKYLWHHFIPHSVDGPDLQMILPFSIHVKPKDPCLQMTAGGSLTAERVKELEDMREKFGLSKESAQKIIKGAQNQHLIANMNVRPPVLHEACTRSL